MIKFYNFICGFCVVFSFFFTTSNCSAHSNLSAAEVKVEEKTDVEKAFGEEYDNSFLYKKTWLWFFTKEITIPATQAAEYMKKISDEQAYVAKLKEEAKDSTAKIYINPTYSSFEATGKNLLKGEQKQRSYRCDYSALGDNALKEFEAQNGFEDAPNKKATFIFSNANVLFDIFNFLSVATFWLFFGCFLFLILWVGIAGSFMATLDIHLYVAQFLFLSLVIFAISFVVFGISGFICLLVI